MRSTIETERLTSRVASTFSPIGAHAQVQLIGRTRRLLDHVLNRLLLRCQRAVVSRLSFPLTTVIVSHQVNEVHISARTDNGD